MCREDPPDAVSADAERDAGKVPCRGLFGEDAKVLGDPARDFSTLQEKVAIAKAKKQEEESKASVLRVSYTGWDAQDLFRINEMFRSSDCTRAVVQQARARELHGPPMPSLELRSALAEADDSSWEVTQPNCLAWVAQMCRQRDEFSKVALIFGDSMDAPPFAFALGHASKQPFWAALFCLQPTGAAGAAAGSSDVVVAPRQAHLHNWRVGYEDFFFEDSSWFAEPPTMVVPSLRFESKAVAWSDVEASPYKVFVEGLPAPPKLPTRKASKKHEIDPTLTAKHPWVHRIVAKHSGSSGGGHAGLLLIEEKELDEEELKAVYDAVAEAKFEIAAGHGEGGEEAAFAVEPTNNSHRGHGSRLAIDSYRGRPSPGLPSDWVNEFLPKGHRSATFSIKKYGASFAVGLCEIWVRLMQSWYDQWLASGDADDFKFAPADVQGCTAPNLQADIDALPATHTVRVRLASFRSMLPHRQL